MFSIDYVLRSLRFFKLKLEENQYKQENAPKSYQIEIKILANPGLANQALNNPALVDLRSILILPSSSLNPLS